MTRGVRTLQPDHHERGDRGGGVVATRRPAQQPESTRAERDGHPRIDEEAGDREKGAHRRVPAFAREEILHESWSHRGAAGADCEREGLVHWMAIRGQDAPRHHVATVGELREIDGDLASDAARMVRGRRFDLVAVVVEHADCAERYLNGLVEPEEDLRR